MSGEPARFDRHDMARWIAKRRHFKTKPGPRPTLGQLQRATPWVWVYCDRCLHRSPLACAVAVIRWGPQESSDKLRRCARCTACGHKGATIQHPSWVGEHVGFAPFPAETK
jgi:hypothetical protein